jgi:hypothetical protein
MRSLLMMVKITKEMLLETAKECHSFQEMSKKLNIKPTPVSQYAKQFEIYGQIRGIFRANRQTNPVWIKSIHTRESIMDIIKKKQNRSVADIGRYLNVTRERARQIINKLGIENEVFLELDMNRYGIRLPEKNIPCVFSLYFQNDPTSRKFFSHTHYVRRAIKGYYKWLKQGQKISHPLIQACKKYGLKNFRWEIIKECSPGDLRKEIHKVIMENIGHSMNLKMIQPTKRYKLMLLQRRLEKLSKVKKPKKSKYPGVYYHRLSGLWMAKPTNPKTGKQKYLGYYPTEEKASNIITRWLKKIN